MHMLIYGLVPAESPIAALEAAKHDVFAPVVEDSPFDYYRTFDAEGRGSAGRDRWGDYPIATEVESGIGEDLVDRAWTDTVEEHRRNFDRVGEFFEEHDHSEFWQDRTVHRQYYPAFRRIGQRRGPTTYLYDHDGTGVLNRDHLDRVLADWDEHHEVETPAEQQLYVVPADVHY